MSRQRGFSLVELLIVVAIILIIVAIAIPNLMRSRIAANDSAAAASVRTINTAETTFQSAFPLIGFGSLATLGPGGPSCPSGGGNSTESCILDGVLGCSSGVSGAFCTKDEFKYTITVNNSGSDYVIYAMPVASTQGDKDYCSAPDMVVRWQPDPSASGATTTTDSACAGGSFNPL